MSVNEVILGLVSLIGSFLLAQVAAFFRVKYKQVKALSKNEIVNNALTVVEGTVEDVVIYLKTTMVDEIKEKSADGKLTKEEIQDIVNHAKLRILTIAKDDSLELLKTVVDDVDGWLENKIEKHVSASKK